MNATSLKIWLLPLALQFAFYYQLHEFWDPDSHYFYGWGIPVLSLFLIWTRGEDEPTPEGGSKAWLIPAAFCFIGFAVLRVLWETMSSWHMLSWTEGFCLAGFTLFWGLAWGGGRYTRHYAFPILFFLACIPWPGRIELGVSDWLTGHIAHIVTVSLQLLGIPAMVQGIQISIGDAVVEVAEACSGIRSLQFLLVTTLFLGEYGKFSLPRRIALLVAGMIASFIQNAIRALALGWITGIEGKEAYDRWHDNTGAITFVIGLSLVFIAFLIIEPKAGPKKQTAKTAPAAKLPGICLPLSTLLLIAYVGVELFRWQWYDIPAMTKAKAWRIDESQLRQLPWHRQLKVNDLVKDIYETDEVLSGQFLINNSLVTYYFVSWEDGYPLMRANAHTPEVCMGTVNGLEQTKKVEVQNMKGSWSDIVYEDYEFLNPISAQRIAVYRSMMLPVSTEKYDQFYEQAKGSWSQKWRMTYENFWERIDENSMLTNQLLLIGVNAPEQVDIDQTLYQFLDKVVKEQPSS
ncbi:exosortase/archaeosortase family protein [Cerasicoccus frondis]|uniref:exosortase/archaeosortase family protein n=1 Tax=Cerasicoccus frondis TaxID=490090 RepID=UPI002852A83E|nr:exosortase/archaeosortase family protein [Cerasicoccus frondis]